MQMEFDYSYLLPIETTQRFYGFTSYENKNRYFRRRTWMYKIDGFLLKIIDKIRNNSKCFLNAVIDDVSRNPFATIVPNHFPSRNRDS